MKKVKLGAITDSCLGKMLDSEKNKGIYQPYLANINVRWGDFDLDNLSMMRFESTEEERYGILKGDLIVCEGGEPGRCAIWDESMPDMKIQKALHRVRAHSGIDIRYIYYWMLLAGKRNLLNNYFTGSTIKHLPGDKLKEIVINIPDYKSQQKISDVLSSIDALIKKNNQINDNLQHQLKLMYDYWFTQFDFPDENGKPYRSSGGAMVWNEQLRKEIPKGWGVSKFSSILDILKDGTHNPPKRVENGIPLLTGTMFEDCFLDYSKATFITKNDYETIHSQYAPQAGDIIITKIGTIGNVNYLREIDIPISIHCNSALLRFKADYDSAYSLFMCKSKTFQKRLEFAKGQSVQAFVSLDRIGSILVEVPPSNITKMFNQKAEKMLKALINISLENSRLIALRDWLLPMLMNGQATIAD